MHLTHALNTKQDGIALLEVLIAVVIISFGLLGLAGTQVTAIRNNHVAYMRSIATHQAQEMADRMRANMIAAETGAYDSPGVNPRNHSASGGCATTLTGCTSTEIAENDTFHWAAYLAANLPGGEGAICFDDTPGDGTAAANPGCSGVGQRVIKIWWNEANATPGAVPVPSGPKLVVNF